MHLVVYALAWYLKMYVFIVFLHIIIYRIRCIHVMFLNKRCFFLKQCKWIVSGGTSELMVCDIPKNRRHHSFNDFIIVSLEMKTRNLNTDTELIQNTCEIWCIVYSCLVSEWYSHSKSAINFIWNPWTVPLFCRWYWICLRYVHLNNLKINGFVLFS